jgi:formylglycine-generating enzyme required for sulfatase activity
MRPKTIKNMSYICIVCVIIFGLLACVGCDNDEDPPVIKTTWYKDADVDSYGNPDDYIEAEAQPDGYVEDNTDCDDSNNGINPDAADICDDGIDNDCDGDTDYDDSACFTTNSFGMTFNLIPAGTFMMGSPPEEYEEGAETLHAVTLTKDFYMQTTEITQEQWEGVLTVAEDKGISIGGLSKTPSFFTPDNGFPDCPDCPVEQVSWDDIQIFIGVLNQLGEGTYSLPTEAQWEYSARAGSTTAFANGEITAIVGGNDPVLDLIGWYYEHPDSTGTTHEVAHAQLISNAWGLYDMHGNVWEWCKDLFTYDLGSEPVEDPTGPVNGAYRVYRGGCWSVQARDCRSASRDAHVPGYRSGVNGFRLLMLPGQ